MSVRDLMTKRLLLWARRDGWADADTRGLDVDAVLSWGGDPPRLTLIIRSGGATLVEHHSDELTRWEHITPDNITRVQRYIEQTTEDIA